MDDVDGMKDVEREVQAKGYDDGMLGSLHLFDLLLRCFVSYTRNFRQGRASKKSLMKKYPKKDTD